MTPKYKVADGVNMANIFLPRTTIEASFLPILIACLQQWRAARDDRKRVF